MIPTVDNYFYQRFKKILRAILESVDDKDNESYVIGEALHGYSQDLQDNFKKAFGITKDTSKLPIDVSFSYPNVASQANACYVIKRGKSEENSQLDGIGNQTASGSYGRPAVGESIVGREKAVIAKDETGFYVTTSYPILEMLHINEMDDTYLDTDNFKVGSNQFRLTANVNDRFLGSSIHVSYVRQDTGSHKDYYSTPIGYAVKEQVIITSLSNNADTVRELDSILKFALIYMRNNYKESDYYQNPYIHTDPLSLLSLGGKDGESVSANVYAIDTYVDYDTTYQVSKDSATRIKEIMVSLPHNLNGESEDSNG